MNSNIKLIQQPDGRRNFLRCAFTLHAARREDDFQTRIPALHDVQHVANRRAGGGRDQADALRIFGQRPFPFRREQSLRRKLLLEFLEGDLQRADALQCETFSRLNSTQLNWAAASLSVKYMWPEDCARRLVTSPVTQTWPTDFSSNRLTCAVNSETDKTFLVCSVGNSSPKSHCDLDLVTILRLNSHW